MDYLLQDWDHATPRDVDWVSGAALMMRRDLLDRIGGFDEDYYMYCEDVDLCWRANHTPLPADVAGAVPSVAEMTNGGPASGADGSQAKVGGLQSPARNWRVTYYPDAVIYHLIGKSSDQAPTRMTYEFHRSQYLFYRKHYAAATPLLVRPLIPAGIALRALGTMVRYRIRYWQRRLAGKEGSYLRRKRIGRRS
jgi:hypothetical protein